MDEHFIALSRRQTMTLLMALTYGGREGIDAFDHLPEAEATLLRQRALAISTIPRDRRVPLIAQELRRLIAHARAQLCATDPDRIALILRHERPALVEAALRALPLATAEAVRERLPKRRASVPTPVPKRRILEVVKWKLEEAVRREAAGDQGGELDLLDLALLGSRELAALCDRLGAWSIAPFLAGLSQSARERWVESLRPDLGRLAMARVPGAESPPPAEEQARESLARFGADPPSAVRSAGASEVVRAALSHSPELVQRMAERHPKGIGQHLERWIREADAFGSDARIASARRVVAEMERLTKDGIIDRSAIRGRRERWRPEK